MRPSPTLGDDERRVLGLAADGLSVPEVAELLDWSRERVRAAIVSAITTLGATSKLEAIIIAYRRGELGDAGA
jgi:DNA-binding NarL/FixJ family response regulator